MVFTTSANMIMCALLIVSLQHLLLCSLVQRDSRAHAEGWPHEAVDLQGSLVDEKIWIQYEYGCSPEEKYEHGCSIATGGPVF